MLWVSGRQGGHRQGELQGPGDVVIPYREWRRPGAKGVILYLHGQSDHSGPFTAMGDRFHELGYNLYAHDHRGFGLSRERRGHIDTYDRFVGDALAMLAHAQAANPGLPLYLLGLSMGGHIALRTACRAQDQLAGVIALSPGFKLRSAPAWSHVLRAVWYSLLHPSPYMPGLPDVERVVTTRNERHLERARQDEYWVTAYTGRFYLEAVRSIRRAWRELPRLRLPALVLQAGEDHLICPEESRRFFERIGHSDKEYRVMEGLYHNLVVEPEMPEIASQITAWMESRPPKNRTRN